VRVQRTGGWQCGSHGDGADRVGNNGCNMKHDEGAITESGDREALAGIIHTKVCQPSCHRTKCSRHLLPVNK